MFSENTAFIQTAALSMLGILAVAMIMCAISCLVRLMSRFVHRNDTKPVPVTCVLLEDSDRLPARGIHRVSSDESAWAIKSRRDAVYNAGLSGSGYGNSRWSALGRDDMEAGPTVPGGSEL